MKHLRRRQFPSPHITYQHILVIACVFAVVIFGVGLVMADQRGDDRVEQQQTTQDDSEQQIRDLLQRVESLRAEVERATLQANTSIDQLVKAGEAPIIAAPDVVTVPTTPGSTTTTTALPPVIVIPPRDETTTTTTETPTTTTTSSTTTTTTEASSTTTTSTTTEPETTTTAEPGSATTTTTEVAP